MTSVVDGGTALVHSDNDRFGGVTPPIGLAGFVVTTGGDSVRAQVQGPDCEYALIHATKEARRMSP